MRKSILSMLALLTTLTINASTTSFVENDITNNFFYGKFQCCNINSSFSNVNHWRSNI